MQFGVYLVDNDLITYDDFFEAVKLQLRTRPQIGAVAVELKKLNVRQVFAILRRQCDAPNELFGNLAIEAGFLSQKDVDELIAEQLQRVRPLRELLVDMGVLTQEQMERYHADFRQTMQKADDRCLVTSPV